MKNLLIIGAGGHGKVVADIAENIGHWAKISFVDDNELIKTCLDKPVIGGFSKIRCLLNDYTDCVVALGNNHVRINMLNKLSKYGFNFPTLIHPTAIVSKYANIGKGTVVMANAIVNPGSSIEMGCIINSNALVEHDCKIGIGVHLSPCACLSGTVSIGDETWIGSNATIINNIEIGKNSIIGAGSVVINDIEDNVIYVGNPAKFLRKNGGL